MKYRIPFTLAIMFYSTIIFAIKEYQDVKIKFDKLVLVDENSAISNIDDLKYDKSFLQLGVYKKKKSIKSVSYTHLTLPTICSV